jgi:hypothetical protein
MGFAIYSSPSRKGEAAMVTALSQPYLITSENRQLICVPEGQGEALRLHLIAAGVSCRLCAAPGLSAELICYDGEPDVVQSILDHWQA